jgi:AcrR family transcriptional regulator
MMTSETRSPQPRSHGPRHRGRAAERSTGEPPTGEGCAAASARDNGAHGAHGARPAHTPHGEAQRRALVLAAYHLIAEGGFERLRTRDVAARAGVNIATLHYYFRTKEDLIRGVVAYLQEQFAMALPSSARGTPQTPLDELRVELADTEYQIREHPGPFIVLFELFLRSLRDPAIHGILQGMDASWQRHIEGYLTAGVAQGHFRADLDVPAAAAGIISLVKGSIVQLVLHPESFPAARLYAEIERWLTGHAPTRPTA